MSETNNDELFEAMSAVADIAANRTTEEGVWTSKWIVDAPGIRVTVEIQELPEIETTTQDEARPKRRKARTFSRRHR